MNTDKIEDILKTIGAEDIPADVQRIAEQTSIDFDKTLTQSRQPRQHILLEFLTKSQITRLAAAALVIVAVLFALNIISDGNGVVWGEVLDNIQKVGAFAYRMKLNMVGLLEEKESVELEVQGWVSEKNGIRTNTYREGKLRTKGYLSIPDRVAVTVIPSQKTYLRMTLTDELFEKIQKEYYDPRKLVEEFMKYEYTKLGRSTINGIEVEGIECRDPGIARGVAAEIAGEMIGNVVARLWAAVENDLPVRLQIEAFAKDGEKALDVVTYGYQWDIKIDPREFEPDIPDDYKLAADVELSSDEKSVVEGLGFFAEYVDGKYPSDMSAMTMARELRAGLLATFGGEPPWPPKQGDENRVMSLEMSIRFYAGLVIDDKDPAYYGDKVTAEFPHAVLMRWKIEDGKYRIIFGDLTARDVSAGELAQLEAMPLNTRPRAVKPQPADRAEGTTLTGLKLSWIPGADATGHKVYFGARADQMSLLDEVTTDYAGLPELKRSTTYYWRVDEVQPEGSVETGDIWSFNTGRLVAWWKLDDGSGTTAVDSSGNGHNGTLVGDTSWVDGIDGGALAFDGDGDYVDIGKDPDFDIKNQITVSAWIKVNAFDRDWQAIVAKGDRAWRLQRNTGDRTLEFACSGLVAPGTDWGQIYGNTDVNDGHWHHVAGVYDEEKLYLYIDGNLDASAVAPGTIRVNDEPVYIGENSQTPNRFWNGLIDDVRIYSYALSAEEISEIAQNALLLSLPK
ncbi:MAG TPA: LamG domain-containing protein [Sedimentisphaerales bacterium]|nr:LamG domain-containing protein [Sedimentisphaerales bacterium]